MDLNAIQKIRNAPEEQKYQSLMEGIFGPGILNRDGICEQMEDAIHKLENFRFSIDEGYYMTIITPDDTRKPIRKVVVTANAYDTTINKERQSRCYGYSFLRDYLGLDGQTPLSLEEMRIKYPQASRGVSDSYDWYDTIARMLIKGAQRQFQGPGAKRF
ncbi:hypothetical protein IK112_00150 [Candidatus Saccharibacteria bacterium]|nr:hypothetical protein [Candidatus Saccharibacteria bacterium]